MTLSINKSANGAKMEFEPGADLGFSRGGGGGGGRIFKKKSRGGGFSKRNRNLPQANF